MKPTVVWFEIYVQDMARARKFYETVFELKLEKLPDAGIEMWFFPAQPEGKGAGGALVYMQGFPVRSGNTIVYFSCDDCAVEQARAVASGGRIEKAKFPIGPHGFISLVHDTEGTMIGLHSMK